MPHTGNAAEAPSSAPNRRERRSADIRERLFRAAMELFLKKGIAETTVEDITNAADVGKGTFFNYFPSKDHIFLAFAEMQIDKLAAHVEEARHSTESMPVILRGLFSRMIAEPERNPAVIRLLLQANLASEPVRLAMLANHTRANGLVGELISIGQQRGEIRGDIAAVELAVVLRQSMFGNVLLWSLNPQSGLRERMNTVFEILWTGLAPRNSGGGAAVETKRKART